MSVVFSNVVPPAFARCSVCLDFVVEDAMSHDNLHFVCEKCLETWAKHHWKCPVCSAPFKSSSDCEEEESATSEEGFPFVVSLQLGSISSFLTLQHNASYHLSSHPCDHSLQETMLCLLGIPLAAVAIGSLLGTLIKPQIPNSYLREITHQAVCILTSHVIVNRAMQFWPYRC